MGFFSDLSVAPPWLWLGFVVCILVMLVVDLYLFGHAPKTASQKSKALIESGLWIALALLFNTWFAHEYGATLGIEFLTGYLVEKSLSVDNLFVIYLIFSSLRIPKESQHKVLFYGVLGAIVLRCVFILIGAKLLHIFEWILYVFGAILIITAVKFLRDSDEALDAEQNWTVRWLKKFFPITPRIEGEKFFLIEGGVRKATPLFIALIVIEATDVIFAVDSIPAVFAVTQDAFVAFGSNILAILGLRALYFVLAEWVGQLRYLKPGLALILGFIGTKMLLMHWFHIPSWVSLLVIIGILSTAALSSWYVNRLEERRSKQKTS